MGAWMLPAIIVLPLLSAAVVGYFRNTWSKTTISWVACTAVFATFAMTVALLFQFLGDHEVIRTALTQWGDAGLKVSRESGVAPQTPFRLGLMADGLSLWWMLVVTGCGFLIHVYSTGYMKDDESFGRFMAKLNFFIYAMSLLVLSDNLVGMLIGWANVGLASYMLIGFYIKKRSANDAAMKAFVMNIIGEVGLIAAIAFIYKYTQAIRFDEVFASLEAARLGTATANMIGLLLLVGAVAKSAQLPLHTWLPYAMEGPTPVSALIHAATMVTAGVYLISRMWPIFEVAQGAALAVAWVGGLGALFGALVAAGQNDIKRVLAFSTLSQIGYMFLGNGLGTFSEGAGYIAADFHFFTHAFFKAALFLCAGIVVHHYNGDQDIRRMGGLWHKDKFATWVFGIGALALIGIFPFAGFFSKDEILLTAWHASKPLFVIGMLAAMMTAFYNVRLFSLVFLGAPYQAPTKVQGKRNASSKAHAHGHDDAHAHGHEHHATPATMVWPVAILAVLSVVAGALVFFPHWQVSFLESSFAGLAIHPEKINLAIAGAATVLALIGGGASWYLYGPNGVRRDAERDLMQKGGILFNMFYVDALYDVLFVQPAKGLASFVSDIADAKVVDGIVNGLGTVAAAVGSGLRVLQNGFIRRYALTVFTGVALMLAYFMFYV